MDVKLLQFLCCPYCKDSLQSTFETFDHRGRVVEGKLRCSKCKAEYPIINSIPRFIETDNYARSFGFQWNLFKHTQVDHYSNTQDSEKRFYSETDWTQDRLKDNWVLEIGCGNGRFLDICSRSNCEIVGVDMSNAVDAAQELFKDRPNVHLVQASIYNLPFKKKSFDKCYCIGVIQHTPDPIRSLKIIPSYVKVNGEISVTIYEKRPWTLLSGKYLLRPVTRRLNKKLILLLIKILSPILFFITEILFRIPLLKNIFKFFIPYANYVDAPNLKLSQRYEWAILDTFDMLTPRYDTPMSYNEVAACLEDAGIRNLRRLPNNGVNIVGKV